MSITPLPAPTALLAMVTTNGNAFGHVGVDLVCIPEAGTARVLIPVADLGLSFRLEFTREQLGALLDELVELADVLEGEPSPAVAEAVGLHFRSAVLG